VAAGFYGIRMAMDNLHIYRFVEALDLQPHFFYRLVLAHGYSIGEHSFTVKQNCG